MIGNELNKTSKSCEQKQVADDDGISESPVRCEGICTVTVNGFVRSRVNDLFNYPAPRFLR